MKKEMWIGIGVVVVLVVGVLGYMNKHAIKTMLMGSAATTTPNDTMYGSTAPTTTPTAMAAELVITKADAAKGNYLVAANGMTLYTYDKDTKGKVSACVGGCATAWPPYTTTEQPATMPSNVTVIKRADGSLQYAYNGWNLYYYAKDAKSGDLTGDGVGGIWHIVKP